LDHFFVTKVGSVHLLFLHQEAVFVIQKYFAINSKTFLCLNDFKSEFHRTLAM